MKLKICKSSQNKWSNNRIRGFW